MPVSSESFLEDFPTMFALVLHSNPICDADPSCSLWISCCSLWILCCPVVKCVILPLHWAEYIPFPMDVSDVSVVLATSKTMEPAY